MNKNYKNSRQNNFPQQTHFIGVLVPEEITLKLEDCRRYMNEKYGCKSGYGTPIHITLVPPFRLPGEFSSFDLFQGIKSCFSNSKEDWSFEAHVENFDAFGDRTIFVKVLANEKWNKIRDNVLQSVLNVAPGSTKKDARFFQPHLTVANRDIPAGVSKDVLEIFNELNLVTDFTVDNIAIFERHDRKWETAFVLDLK